jgi:hypothetical protein
MVYYLADRPAYMKPIRFDVYKQEEREDFPEQIDLARDRLRGGSIFVFFSKPSAEEEEFLAMLPIKTIYSAPGVKVFAYDPATG